MSCQAAGATSYTPYIQQLSFNLENMLKKAKTYSEKYGEKSPSYLSVDEKNDCSKRLFEYIENILKDDKFQSNSHGYLNAWKERRGGTEEVRIPEDLAREFFDKNFPIIMKKTDSIESKA